jgi:hypothetical protein
MKPENISMVVIKRAVSFRSCFESHSFLTNDKEEKLADSQRPDLPCSYYHRLCHSAIDKVSHERACGAQLAEENSTKDEKSHIYVKM